MDLRASPISLKFTFNPGILSLGSPSRVNSLSFPVCALKLELTPKELHHQRKKEEWKRQRRARRLEKEAEKAKVREQEERTKAERRRKGLCSFEKYKLAKDQGNFVSPEWKSGVKGRTTLMSRFEQEFAIRVRSAVDTVRMRDDGEVEESVMSSGREDSDAVSREEDDDGVSDDWLLAYGLGLGFGSREGEARESAVGTDFSGSGTGESASASGIVSRSVPRDDIVDKNTQVESPSESNVHLIEHLSASASISNYVPRDDSVDKNTQAESRSKSNVHTFERSFIHQSSIDKNVGSRDDTNTNEEAELGTHAVRDWRVKPRIPRPKDRAVGHRIIDRRKGEPLSVLLDENSTEAHGILEAVYDDVTGEVPRKEVDEREQLEWLVVELCHASEKQKFFLSRLMHGARLKWTDGRLLEVVKMLGARREWRRAMEVVHWVHCREHFKHCRNRYVCTTLVAVLGKCLRPVEALNVFNVMREDHSTYPNMAAYHSVAVTLGKAGHLTELLHLIQSLKKVPVKKHIRGTPNQLNWDGRLEPDIVVYNAVINACGPQRQWEGVRWVLRQLQSSGVAPNSTTFGLAIEVMVKSGQFDRAWRYYESMERGNFLPNALTFKALVEGLGMAGEVDKAVDLVEDMERRGVIECAGVYYALASALCTAGRLSDALVQVEKLIKLPSKQSDVVTFTGLIRTCDKVGRWQDAVSLFKRMQSVCAPNVGTYNIMIALYGRHHIFEEARNIFESVKRGKHTMRSVPQSSSRLTPNERTYESMLGACAVCEDWGYFEVVLDEFYLQGFHLDCGRHAWFLSPIVKAGQERLLHLMTGRLQPSNSPPSTDLYRTLLPLLTKHKQFTLMRHYLDTILNQGVAPDTPEWSSILGKALEQLPMVDAEQFLCSKASDDDKNRLVLQLLECLVSVGGERKARRLVSLLGLGVGDGAALVDGRLLPSEGERIVLGRREGS